MLWKLRGGSLFAMLIVNTSVSGAFNQLHHSPFLTKYITFADVPPLTRIIVTLVRQYFLHFFSVQDFQRQFQSHHFQNYVVEQFFYPDSG